MNRDCPLGELHGQCTTHYANGRVRCAWCGKPVHGWQTMTEKRPTFRSGLWCGFALFAAAVMIGVAVFA